MIGLASAGLLLLPLVWAQTAAQVGVVLLATSVGKGLFDGCIYAAMHDVMPPRARATAVGLMTMLGFFGAGLTPILVPKIAQTWGMAGGMTSVAGLYFLAVVLLFAMRSPTRRAVEANAQAGAS
jgi:sugar phosphate permease